MLSLRRPSLRLLRASVFFVPLAVAAPLFCLAAANPPDPAWPADKPTFPTPLPGRGLAHHDFFYAGEAKTQDMVIVRAGRVAWEFHDSATKGEISDAVLYADGRVLFAHQFGVTLLGPDKKILWHHDAPPKTEIHTAVPIGRDRLLYVQNGDPAKVIVVNHTTGVIEREFTIPVKTPAKIHGHFRHARLTAAGTLLVAHMDLGQVVEYDATGKALWSHTPGFTPWSAVRLPNGHTLMTGAKIVREITSDGATAWEFTPADVPDYKFDSMQVATRLANGHTLINTWVNQWSGKIDPATIPVQALEITADKKIVWALRAWDAPVNLGPATIIQLLDDRAAPLESAHFGDLR